LSRKRQKQDKMLIGILTVELFIPDSHSLKEKRAVVKGLKERIRHRFNVSVAETDYHELWQRAEVKFLMGSMSKKILDSTFDSIVNFIANANNGSVLGNYSIEVI